MPDCHEHPFDHTECVHGGHDWCYHCADELIASTREKCAKIAEAFKSIGGNALTREYCDNIAAAIRAGK